jgi:indole-3-glycerol phosphate synthase
MENILDKILAVKKQEVERRKELFPAKLLEESIYFPSPTVSMKKYLLRSDKSGIIAEIKRKSPSKGVINPNVSVERISIGYMQAGASGLSILTDSEFFGGKNEDLTTARNFNFCPILRKDFIIDEYQIIEAKSIGADVILLIAAALPPKRLKGLAQFAKSLGLEVLMEVHNEEELLNNIHPELDIVGVNNRDLKRFVTDINISKELVAKIPEDYVKISESGISDPAVMLELKECGFEGFLIGEQFMKESRPEVGAKHFIERFHFLEKSKTQTV